MAKRRPDQQLTQNNWDDELERDEVGQFQKADNTEMKNRVIRVAKRRIARQSDETDASETGAKPVSVFSGFSLVSNKSSTIGSDAAASKPMFSFGSSFSSQPSGAPFTSSSTASAAFGALSKPDGNKSTDFVAKLKDLNEAVLSCIKGHIEGGRACILTPIFKDYEKYVKELEDKDKNATTSSPAKPNNATTTSNTAAFSFSFGGAKSTAPTESSGTNAAASVVSTPTQSTSAAPMFSFGKPTTAFGTASSSGFTFSSAIQTQKPAETEKKGDGENGNGDTENADEESDEPPKVEFKPVVEDDSIYSKRCKVFVKEDGEYKGRGTGTLYLKKVKDDNVQLIVRADTNLGNISLNFLLSSASPPKLLKNNVMIVCVPTPESDPTKPKSVLIRVKNEEEATELLQEIEQYQK